MRKEKLIDEIKLIQCDRLLIPGEIQRAKFPNDVMRTTIEEAKMGFVNYLISNGFLTINEIKNPNGEVRLEFKCYCIKSDVVKELKEEGLV